MQLLDFGGAAEPGLPPFSAFTLANIDVAAALKDGASGVRALFGGYVALARAISSPTGDVAPAGLVGLHVMLPGGLPWELVPPKDGNRRRVLRFLRHLLRTMTAIARGTPCHLRPVRRLVEWL